MPEEKSKYYGDKVTGPMAKAGLSRVIKEGIYAQRKLNGDPDIISAPEDEGVLRALVEAGKDTEKYCEEIGLQVCIRAARAGAE